MLFTTTLEHNETAYGQNSHGFDAFVPNAFGADPVQMEKYYNQIYVHGQDLRFPPTPAMIAGAAAYKAVRLHDAEPYSKPHVEAINSIRAIAAQEAQALLQRFVLPDIDPIIVIMCAEAGAHRLYDHEHY